MNLDFLYFDYRARHNRLKANHTKLSHYTTVENALNILNNQTLWLRRADGMRDRFELKYGMELISNYQRNHAQQISSLSNFISIPLTELLTFENEKLWKKVWSTTYLTSFVEHELSDDQTGRIDMWDRYSAPEGLAFVLKPNFLNYNDRVLGLNPLPARYFDQEYLDCFMSGIASNLVENSATRDSASSTSEIAFQLACLVISIKNPAYRKEDEWRLVANNSIDAFGPHLKRAKNPDRVELDLSSRSQSYYKLSNSLDKVIIGPSNQQLENQEVIRQKLNQIGLGHVNVIATTL